MACSNDIKNRIKRAEGQLRGILRMLEEEKECEAIITQLSAVHGSIERTIALMLTENLLQAIEKETGPIDRSQPVLKKALDLQLKKYK